MPQELYTQLQQYALNSKTPKLNQSLVGKHVLFYDPDNLFEAMSSKEGRKIPERPEYSDNGTIYVGKVANVRNVSMGEKLWIGWYTILGSSFGLPRIGVKFEDGTALAVTPQKNYVVQHHFEHTKEYPDKPMDLRVLDDEGLVSEVLRLLNESKESSLEASLQKQ